MTTNEAASLPTKVYFDGVPPEHQASLTLGYGVFTTLKVLDGQPQQLDAHLTRLNQHAQQLNLNHQLPPKTLKQHIDRYLRQISTPDIALKISLLPTSPLNLNQGVIYLLTHRPIPKESHIKLRIAPNPLHSQRPLAGIKTLSYADNIHTLNWAKSQGADDAILLNERQELVETTIANLFLKIDGQWHTPSLESGCLAGIARDHFIQENQAKESTLTLDDLNRAEAIQVTNSLRVCTASLLKQ